ncbi:MULTISPECIES: Dps family protein [Phaeobacter]|uniref:Ferritin n=1 Tax=Phaeobacter gallaeciensis TaxID=60890 RepID=A0AAC9Z8G4_9RHOB|nr:MULTISPECIES: DNA starvation/stationary phase protection protein [Phaeobacter]AHD08500.1 DNA-binding protein ferritin-like protein (oxidative damage protectant) [Phaeobacter gallaeciensis DSM 26640]ATE91766.1 putative ferritin [Phaeobacter gallaeciensis]ATE98410.1 putative ferritin [Phaeobacter gallaeciensis]ATF00382.1 putative ferritin [Phaeobacter gallaeciensis]ATF04814.1 putative ferritin [Phaeobacter gallaeciensis]
MSEALSVVPSRDDVATGVRDTSVIASGIADVLADTYRLVFKTHAYHWNVEGPAFYSVHKLTEEQYENMFAAADDLAERIRALGHLAPSSLADIVGRSKLEDKPGGLTAAEMVEDLAHSHERVAHRLHALAELAGDRKDIVTEDLATARSAFHEQAAWMLRAISKG